VRTTLNIDSDVLRVLKAMAESRGTSVGSVVTELVRKALRPADSPSRDRSLPIFHVSDDAAPITLEDVKRAEEEL